MSKPAQASMADAHAETLGEARPELPPLEDAWQQWQQRLPVALRSEWISVRSDLHYLDVRTTQGEASVLGAISQLAADAGDIGMQIHRSFWVNLSFVEGIEASPRGHDVLVAGRRLPIGRRRLSALRARLQLRG
jgi:DNA-binding LytR/AlgR family response regulator